MNPYDLQGVGFLVEPYRRFKLNGEYVYVVWIDLDNCRNAESEEIEPWAVEIVQALGTYAEVSPSGEGIRVKGFITQPKSMGSWFYTLDGTEFSYWRDIPESSRDGYHRVEVYGANRGGGQHLITFTGMPLEGHDKPVRNIQKWIDESLPLKEHMAEDVNVDPEPLDFADEEVLRVMLASKDGPLTERLMAGDESLWKGEEARHRSRSEADLGFLRKLAFYTRGEREQIRRIALSSKMRREKWNREGYLSDTIEQAIKYCQGTFYNPEYSSKDELIQKFFEVWMSLKDYKVRRALGALLAMTNAYGQYTREGYIVKAHGQYYAFPEEGLWVYASHRDLGIWMGEGDVGNVSRAMKALREEGLVQRISMGRGSKSSLYLLPTSLVSSLDAEEIQYSEIQHRRGTQGSSSPPEHNPCVSLLCCKSESKTYLEIVWTQKPKKGKRGLTNDQKLLLELVHFGEMRSVKELGKFFGKREDNLRSRVVKPTIEMGLLEWDGDEKAPLKIPEGFEETLHELFVESGGKRALKAAEEQFVKDRDRYLERGEEANEDDWGLEVEERQAAVLRGELDYDEMPSGWALLKAYYSRRA